MLLKCMFDKMVLILYLAFLRVLFISNNCNSTFYLNFSKLYCTTQINFKYLHNILKIIFFTDCSFIQGVYVLREDFLMQNCA